MNLFALLLTAALAPAAFSVETCDGEVVEDVELTNALVLEVSTAGVVVKCGEVWRFNAEGFEPVIVDHLGTPEHLVRRTFALAVQAGLRPRAPPPPPTPRAPRVNVQVDLGLRLFLVTPPSVLGSMLIRVMTPVRLWVGFELGLSSLQTEIASVSAFALLGVVGARLFELPVGSWGLVGDVGVECGALILATRSLSTSYVGGSTVRLFVGGWGLVGLQRRLSDGASVQFGARIGYDWGAFVRLLGVPALSLSGPFVGLQVAARF